ncbi:MAG: hypothetical protein K8R02_04705 [Anaerohalosphaeraceae bacterium]|nr:hypothetical protein [Anaerohalosphaeraceae bacterium]
MAKRKSKKRWSVFGSGKRKTKAEKKQRLQAVRTTLWIFVFIILAVVAVAGLIFLDRYAGDRAGIEKKPAQFKLIDVPGWVSPQLQAEIIAASGAGDVDFQLDGATVRRVGENLSVVAWLCDVNVRLTGESIMVQARYRRPMGLIKASGRQYYIDKDMFVLGYVPIDSIAIVEITGVPGYVLTRKSVGSTWARDDIAAALEILELLNKMDAKVSADKPLLGEIASVDLSNYDGRRSESRPHIVFYALDGTEIRWGARKGAWHRHLEARDEEKLAILYNTYEQMGTLQLKSNHKASFIDLATPQNSLSLPIDRY